MDQTKTQEDVNVSDNMSGKQELQDPSSDFAVGSVDAEWTPEEEKAIRWKFDWTITPLVTLLYMLCAIDR